MTLPFEQENEEEKNKRKYQCFVCGRLFPEFWEFKDHILQNHEEGREYIICPLERCGAPVRDMRMHFKVKHPSEKMPTKGMMKALVWKDFGSGRKKTNKPKFRQGWHSSTKMNRDFYFRSSYEKKVYECLDEDTDVMAYEVEPFEIPYIHKGHAHKYTPDILVHYLNGHKALWEIKPANQTMMEQNRDKWDAAEEVCKIRGWEFRTVTEMDIDKLKAKVRRPFKDQE